MLDWGVGEYERTARELEPASRNVVDLAALRADNEDPTGFRVTSPYRVLRIALAT